MFTINEKDIPYRHGDHGPKYLMKGPNSSFGIVKLLPKESADCHLHKIMEENFYVLKGKICIDTDKATTTLTKGQFAHIDANEAHKVYNPFEKEALFTISLAPYAENDKYIIK